HMSPPLRIVGLQRPLRAAAAAIATYLPIAHRPDRAERSDRFDFFVAGAVQCDYKLKHGSAAGWADRTTGTDVLLTPHVNIAALGCASLSGSGLRPPTELQPYVSFRCQNGARGCANEST